MAAVSFYRKKGSMRIYSPATTTTGGASPTRYLEMRFQNGSVNFALGPAFPSQTLVLDRNTFTSEAHFIDADDSEILTPLPLSFELRGVDTYLERALAALSNPFGASTWRVGNFNWTGFPESGITRKNGQNQAITIPTFALAGIQLVRVEFRMQKTSTAAAVTDQVFKFTGVHFPRDQVAGALNDDSLIFTCNGLIYGDVSLTSAFSTGSQTDT